MCNLDPTRKCQRQKPQRRLIFKIFVHRVVLGRCCNNNILKRMWQEGAEEVASLGPGTWDLVHRHCSWMPCNSLFLFLSPEYAKQESGPRPKSSEFFLFRVSFCPVSVFLFWEGDFRKTLSFPSITHFQESEIGHWMLFYNEHETRTSSASWHRKIVSSLGEIWETGCKIKRIKSSFLRHAWELRMHFSVGNFRPVHRSQWYSSQRPRECYTNNTLEPDQHCWEDTSQVSSRPITSLNHGPLAFPI